jgi:hypothetical protein
MPGGNPERPYELCKAQHICFHILNEEILPNLNDVCRVTIILSLVEIIMNANVSIVIVYMHVNKKLPFPD